MSSALADAEGLVTVSSTAAVEAIARGVPVIALDSFGVSEQLLDVVFVGSGLFGGEAAVIGREFRHPEPSWLTANYFHDSADDDWIAQLVTLVALARRGELPVRSVPRGVGGRVRLAWDRRRAFGTADRSIAGAAALAVGAADAGCRAVRAARAAGGVARAGGALRRAAGRVQNTIRHRYPSPFGRVQETVRLESRASCGPRITSSSASVGRRVIGELTGISPGPLSWALTPRRVSSPALTSR